jgi:DNA invertase Pin-like site-specific DNA recombinase
MTRGMKVAGYIRVSTEEQGISGAGLEAQRHAILAECERRGWELAVMHEDVGFSAKNMKRPAIQQALGDLDAGTYDGLVVAKLDRLSRSLLDFAALMDRAQRKGWAIVALDLGVDTSTPAGEAMANVMASFAQFERRLIGQRTKEALAQKKAQGVVLGRPRLLPVKVRRDIERQRAKNRTLAAIAADLNKREVPTAQGGAQWWPSTVRAVLSSS